MTATAPVKDSTVTHLQNVLQASEEALGDAEQDVVVALPRALGQGLERLHDGHEERAQADGPEGGR